MTASQFPPRAKRPSRRWIRARPCSLPFPQSSHPAIALDAPDQPLAPKENPQRAKLFSCNRLLNRAHWKACVGGGAILVSGQHNPGNSPGSQSFANGLAYSTGANVTMEIAADGSAADQITVTGDLDIGANVQLAITLFGTADYTTGFWDSDHVFDLFTYTGTIDGSFSNISFSGLGDPTGEGSWSTSSGGGTISAVWTAVPESATALLGGLGLLALLRRRR